MNIKKFFTKSALLQWGIVVGTLLTGTLCNIPGMLVWAQLSGMLVQPFWMVTSYRAKMWGPFALSIYFSCVWTVGLYHSLFIAA